MTSPAGEYLPNQARTNLEFKAKLTDKTNAVAVAQQLGADDQGVMRQVDTYFAPANGRCKLREISDHTSARAELIYYDRPESESARWSRYQLSPVTEATSMKALLTSALGQRGAVIKSRHLFLWRECRIHIDEVDGLGVYLEFEVLSEGDEGDDRERMDRLMQAFGFTAADAIQASYSDLLGL